MKKIIGKKILALVALMVTSVSLNACTKESGTTATEQNENKLVVGLIQVVENGAFTDMREGFTDYLRENGYTEEDLEIYYKNAQGDISNLNSICQEMISKKVDIIVPIGTPATQAIVNMESDIPVVFISVSNPLGAGIISDMSKPDKNATGTSNAIPIENIFNLADKLTPGCETYGIVYNTGEVNSVTTVNQAKEYLEAQGLKYEEAVVSNSSEVQQAVQMLVGKVDAIFVPNDSVVQDAMELVAEVAKDAKVPVYGSSAVMVNSGAFATIAISDREIGAISAEMVLQYFNGTKIEDIEAVVVPATDTVINRTTAEALGITLSEDVKNNVSFID